MISVNYMDVYEKVFNDFKILQATKQPFKARDFIEQQLGKDREELVILIEVFCTSQPHIKTVDDVAQELVNFTTIVKILDNHHEEELINLKLKLIDTGDLDIDLPNKTSSG